MRVGRTVRSCYLARQSFNENLKAGGARLAHFSNPRTSVTRPVCSVTAALSMADGPAPKLMVRGKRRIDVGARFAVLDRHLIRAANAVFRC